MYKRFKIVPRLFLGALLLTLFSLCTDTLLAQSGKITGKVTLLGSDESLTGVNVILEANTLVGTASDIDGYYTILNIRPGTYTVKATYIGFQPVTISNVVVNPDLTTTLDIEMVEQVFEGQELIITATQPVVQTDVSASVTNIQADDIASLPVNDVASVIGLGAGVNGTSVRGGTSADLEFNVNGISQRSTRSNSASQEISFTSVNAISVQTGGFNAEYGNIQSGLVNVTTKEGNKDKYTVDFIYRILPAQDKNIGPDINDPNTNPFLRPYLDPEVAFTGTGEGFSEGAWDFWTRQQHPQFQGWNAVSDQLLSDNDPNNDLSPYAAQRLFQFQHRKPIGITSPDTELDLTIGGPVPGIGKKLGDLRFSYSLRSTETQYMIPLATDSYDMNYHLLKLTSDLAKGKKLSIEASYRLSSGTNSSRTGLSGNPYSGFSPSIANAVISNERTPAIMYSTDYYNPIDVHQFVGGITYTHAISDKSFYEIRAIVNSERFAGGIGRDRNLEENIEFADGSFTNEGPFGYYGFSQQFIGSGLNMGLGFSNTRDSTRNTLYNLRGDFTSQLNRFNMVKFGVDLQLTDNQTNNARIDQFLTASNLINKWDHTPIRVSSYVQNKLEFKGMIANVGLRMDYVQGSKWFTFSDYDPLLGIGNAGAINEIESSRPAGVLRFSPRLGVSFPITEVSKFYFNYGHFYRTPTPDDLYFVRVLAEAQQVTTIANPGMAIPRTVAYELGYEQSLFSQYLVKIAGYYKDVSDQPTSVGYTNRDASVNYRVDRPNSFRDIRGVELTLRKSQGKYIRGFANYSYEVIRNGRFDFAQQFENPTQQREYERGTSANEIFPAVPQPRLNVGLEFLVPEEIGPSIGDLYPLGGWNVNFIYTWTGGQFSTWTGGGFIPGIVNNVRWNADRNLDFRLNKVIPLANGRSLRLFMDMTNALDYRFFRPNNQGFVLANDVVNYYRSLHLPQNVLDDIAQGYPTPPIPGGDSFGDYRDFDVEFVPIVSVQNLNSVSNPSSRPLYWNASEAEYYQYNTTTKAFAPANRDFVQQVLDDKAYIDMPNFAAFTFFNPRAVQFGFRVNF
jgi:outer membrane receptor protein involved in Fe transport